MKTTTGKRQPGPYRPHVRPTTATLEEPLGKSSGWAADPRRSWLRRRAAAVRAGGATHKCAGTEVVGKAMVGRILYWLGGFQLCFKGASRSFFLDQ